MTHDELSMFCSLGLIGTFFPRLAWLALMFVLCIRSHG